MKKLKSKLSFFFKWINWIFDNIIDRPKIDEKLSGKEKITIGVTVESAPINCYIFWKWEEKILYLWWLHWNEVGTIKLMNKWVNYLWGILTLFPKKYLENKKIFVIPALNIDGYNKAIKNPDYFWWWKIGKTNSNEVDLNRNFPTKNWKEETASLISWKKHPAFWWRYPASEPEIQSLITFVAKERIKTIYVFKNCSWTVFWKWEDYEKWKKVYWLQERVKSYSEYSRYRMFSDLEWKELKKDFKTGHIMKRAKENNIQVIEVETSTRWSSEWRRNKMALVKSLKI